MPLEKQHIKGIAVLVVLAAAFGWWRTRRTGEEDFVRAHESLRSVKSFRVRSVYGGGQSSLASYECPGSIHTIRQSGSGVDDEQIQVGGDFCYRDPESKAWVRGTPPDPPDATCSQLARGATTAPFPPLLEMSRRALFRQGSVVSAGDTKCREWNLQITHPLGTRKAMVCLGVDDFLPRRWVEDGSETTFFDYNKAMDIRAPQGAVALEQ